MFSVIRGVRLIDGTGSDPIPEATILINDGFIEAIGPAREVSVPRDASVLFDADGATALPGLIDAHASIGQLKPDERPRGIDDQAVVYSIARAIANGERSLRCGVTTVRVDFVAHRGLFALREVFDRGQLPGPRMVLPGRAITVTGGHAWASGAIQADGADAMRVAVREEIRAGADWIKLMPTGGAGTPNENIDEFQMTPEEIGAAVDAAHRRHKQVFAHVSTSEAAVACVEAGIDSIEHGFDLDDAAIDLMHRRGVPLVPTLSAYRYLVREGEAGRLADDRWTQDLHMAARTVVEPHAASFRRAIDAGVSIVAGTDAGGDWFPMDQSLQLELEIMVAEGMPPMDAIVSATGRSARLLKMDGSVGTLAAGKVADLVLVREDPIQTVSSLRHPVLVLKGGNVVYRN